MKERETSGALRNDLIDTLVTLKQSDMNNMGDNKNELGNFFLRTPKTITYFH